MKFFSRFTITFFLILLPVASLFAQATPVGAIRGTVTDTTGTSLPGATVEITSEDKGTTRVVVTDDHGEYHVPLLAAGTYRVEVSLSGFDTVTRDRNVVEAQKNTQIDFQLGLGAMSAEITVSGEVPIVDRTTQASETRFRKTELETLPILRGYQTVFGQAPGVSTLQSGNPTVHGALTSNNLFQFDGLDTTDGTTGTFSANLNYEAVQEIVVYTAGISAEYGRAVGGIVNVITKSGSNTPEGSVKVIAYNDEWDAQNTSVNQVTGASLARQKFDQINKRYSATLGGPLWRDRAWFFGAYENAATTGTLNITPVTQEQYQQSRDITYDNYRLTVQLNDRNNVWAKYSSDPDTGIIRDYYHPAGPTAAVFAGEIEALTAQTQGGNVFGVNWSSVWGSRFASEAMISKVDSVIDVGILNDEASIENSAVHLDTSTGFYFNGPTFVGFVDRPRESALVSGTYFGEWGANSHDIKVGIDWQKFESGAKFGFPGNRFYFDNSFDPVTRDFVPGILQVYDEPQASTSTGDIMALFVRDKFEAGERLFMELGLRFDEQQSESDIGVQSFDASTISPRLAASYDLMGHGKTLVVGTVGRFYQFLIQDYIDNFSNVPQQGAYTIFQWDGSQFVQSGRVDPTSNSLEPDLDLNPTYMDEFTVGFEQQIGNTMGIGIRGVFRKWNDLIDDVKSFDPDGNVQVAFTNLEQAERDYVGVETTFDKRFSNRWSAHVNYTWSETTGNHFASYQTADSGSQFGLGDFMDAECRSAVDVTIGNQGVIPCADVTTGANKIGLASYNRPHYLKAQANYSVPLGRANVTLGMLGNWRSGFNYTPLRTVNVINPVTGAVHGAATWFYENRGSHRLGGVFEIDSAIEATWRLWKTMEVGFKGEVFNMTDEQEQVSVNNLTWCGNSAANAPSACQTSRNTFGKATTRAAFQVPRQFQLTGLIRF